MRGWLMLVILAACGRTAVVDFPPQVPFGPDASVDAGVVDAGPQDGGRRDGGTLDAGRLDAGVDAGRPEMGLAQGDVLYVNEDNQLFSFTPATGALARLTGLSCRGATDLAIDRNGRAFLVSGFALFRLNVQSGTCTRIATLPEPLVALAFLPAGLLDQTQESLVGYGETTYWEFDPNDGFASRLGSGTLAGDLVPSGDLSALRDGGTYLTVRDRTWPRQRPDELVRIDPLTGAVVQQLGPIGAAEVWGLATFDDELFAFTADGRISQLSLEDGGVRSTLLASPPGRRFWGAAARPGARSAPRDGGP
jgi:hypothetical protein